MKSLSDPIAQCTCLSQPLCLLSYSMAILLLGTTDLGVSKYCRRFHTHKTVHTRAPATVIPSENRFSTLLRRSRPPGDCRPRRDP